MRAGRARLSVDAATRTARSLTQSARGPAAREPRHRARHRRARRPEAATVGVVVFPGTNCEYDIATALASHGADVRYVWHHDASLVGLDAVVLPGGFAHGDYLRPGAIARFSVVMGKVGEFAASGGPVVGICNGFQVLCEAGLLPGALQKNAGLTFLCEPVGLEVTSTASVLTGAATLGQRLTIPINHFSGAYVCDDATLAQLRDSDRIVLRYTDNPNGSVDDIAGVANEAGNVVGLMPHPERASAAMLGSTDGLVLLRALVGAAAAPRPEPPPDRDRPRTDDHFGERRDSVSV